MPKSIDAAEREKRKAYTRAWRLAHPDRVAEYAKRGSARRSERWASQSPEEREKQRAYQRAWFVAHRDQDRQRRLDYNREWKKAHPGQCLATRHRRLERRAGRPMPTTCEACGRLPMGKSNRLHYDRLHFDHDHATGMFRGWLCHCCNTALGLVEDDQDILLGLVEYLRRSQKLRMV